jgi:hypothetical protein
MTTRWTRFIFATCLPMLTPRAFFRLALFGTLVLPWCASGQATTEAPASVNLEVRDLTPKFLAFYGTATGSIRARRRGGSCGKKCTGLPLCLLDPRARRWRARCSMRRGQSTREHCR